MELPLSIGGVAIYILVFHGDLLGVYWWGAISGGIEIVIVFAIMLRTDWDQCAVEAKVRQEAASGGSGGAGANVDADDVHTSEEDEECIECGLDVPLLNVANEEEAASETETDVEILLHSCRRIVYCTRIFGCSFVRPAGQERGMAENALTTSLQGLVCSGAI